MRLDKAVTLHGMTRSEARKAISAGRVQIKGQTTRDAAAQAEPGDVTVDGHPLETPGELYIMVNKPAGVVTATEDRRLPVISDLLPEAQRRRGPGPVGRLDRDVTGLVLMTTDGQLAHRLISPKWKAEKVYLAQCEGRLTETDVEAFSSGLTLSDFTAKPAGLRIIEADDKASTAEVTLTEGKFHQVKRMFSAIGHPLTALKRIRIGCVTLDEALAEGETRLLTENEITGLLKLCDMYEEG